ncbi:MAG: gliding motility-associated C-terminal domain-containing protein [Paludibacteraceae bacterium]|nr:gliding motility-associated C-terminal domain-containing protein [Paludibacteraceae bacterium]
MKKNYFKSFLIMLMLMCSTFTALAVDYALGGYLNGQDVNNYDGNWKFTQSGSNYVLTKTFSKTDNYFWIFDSNGTKYGVDSYTENNPSTLKQGANEKVGAKGLSTSSATTITFNPSTKQISWSNSSGPIPSASDLYIIGDAIKGWNDASNTPIFVAMTAGTSGEYYYDGLYADREFKFTSQNNWSDASQTIFNDANADNTKSVGATASKVQNGNDTNAKVSLEEGYAEPIKFFVNTSTKKFWAVATKDVTFDLTASKTDYDTANAPTELTLKVSSDNTTTGDFIWYSSTDGTNYTEISGVTGDTYTLSGDDVPMVDTYFKVKRAKADNTTPAPEYLEDTVKISVFQTCGEGTKGSNLFKITFDDDTKLKTLLGAGSRMKFDAMVDGYAYVEAPKKINDGQYAIVTEPLYCGYGIGGQEECGTDLGCIDEKIKNNPHDRWYRGFRDHTQNKGGANPPFGGMLLINFGNIDATNDESGVAFSRVLTPEETKDFTRGSTLTFSAYMASAALKEKPNVTFLPIDAELKIQFRQTGATAWTTVANIESQVAFDDNWKRFETSFKMSDTDGEFRVVIKNNGTTGDGNDLLIDDISLDLCSPTISVEFADKDTEDYTFTSVDDVVSVRVPKVNFGSINDPCLMLFGINENGEYGFIAEMLENGNYYVAEEAISGMNLVEIGDNAIRTIKPMKLQAVVSEKVNGSCSDDVMKGVQEGKYSPGVDPMVVFSSNTLSVDMECLDSKIILLEGESSNVCYSSEMVMPTIKLTSNNLTSSVYLDILVNGEVLIEGVGFALEENEDFMLINLSELYAESKQETYLPEVGELKVTVKVRESYADGVLCEREAEGMVTINIIDHSDAPVAKRPGERYSYNMCQTENEEEGKETDPNIIDNKIPFKDLIEDEDKSGLVWLDLNNNIIPEENAFFYADKVQDDSVRVYRDPAGGCPSDTILVRYRVKAYTPEPVFTKDYNECALGESAELIELKSLIDVEKSFESFDEPGVTKAYKYVDFINQETKLKEITFDPKVPGTRKYTVKVSLDETNSASNNYCESKAEYTVKVKGNATAANIIAKDTAVCSIDSLILLADSKFDKTQSNVVLTWYPDTLYSRDLAYGKTFSYFLLDHSMTEYPDTVYVTVQSDDYCENIPSEAKPVTITLKEQAPSLKLEPKDQTISVGGVPSFTVSPAGEQRYSLYVNDKKVDKSLEEHKPYIDSEYKLVYEGECGSSYDSARVEVQWPTVFTPYVKDGRNDTFVKDMDPNFYTKIFTRFGTKIYESDNGWDGSVGGSMNGSKDVAAPGVYYYVVELPDGNVKKGTIEVFKY